MASMRRRFCPVCMTNPPVISVATRQPTPAKSALQFALELVEETPVGALRNDSVRIRFDHSGLAQAQRIKAHGILGIVVPPLRVADLFHCLEGVVVPITAVRHDASGALGLSRAKVRCLQECS